MHARKTGQIDLFTRRVRRAPAPLEFGLHCMIADVLRRWASPGWKFTHIASGEYRAAATASRLKRMGVIAGWPDFILLPPSGMAHFLELKRRGGGLNDPQREFAAWCNTHGIPFAVAYDFAEALAQLQVWGAVLNSIAISA